MLNIQNITLAYHNKTLCENSSLQLTKGQVCGLVGKNGAGKTTLFKLVLGEKQTEQGDCLLPSNTLISHIEQEFTETKINIVEYILNAHPIYANEQIDLPEYYALRPNAEKLLVNLGFSEEELAKTIAEFSGGWQMRINLAKALFVPSDLLLLDEPTNHLDIETVMWLETWLKSYRGLIIIISHDREFLDNVTTHTVHIYNKKLTLYTGNYSTFERTKAEKDILDSKQQAKSQAKVAHMQKFVDKFKAKASKAKQAQSRMKMIEKIQISAAVNYERNYSIEFLEPDLSSDLLVTIDNASIGYATSLINNIKLQIFAKDRIGILGKNGKGKSTLIKAIINQSTLLNGTIEQSTKIKIGYFAQHTIETLDNDTTPLAFITSTHKHLKSQEVLGILGRFGFSPEIAKGNIDNLSGGEKARLILASIIQDKPNILFLDEPTNHLDMQMRQELAMAINDFDGAVILVSHDKFLLESIVDDFYLIDNNQLNKFSGDLQDYQKFLLAKEEVIKPTKIVKKSTAQKGSGKKVRILETKIDKLNMKLETAKQLLDKAAISNDVAELQQTNEEINNLETQLNSLTEEWLLLQE